MRLVTVSFNYPKQLKRPDYARLLDVFEASVKRHIPGCEMRSIRMDPPDHRGVRKVPFLSNTKKLQIWTQEVRSAVADGENLIVADCDMLCTGDPSHVFQDKGFDVAYTVRDDHTNIPLNGGILFVRPTEASVRFFDRWAEVDTAMYEDWNMHVPWRIKYAGMNQASFGYLLENQGEVPGVRLKELPTRFYNAVNTDWHRITSQTVFIHIKSKLRKYVLNSTPPNGNYRPVMLKWYEEAGIDVRDLH